MNDIRAITVCVDYHDYLRITMPINRFHFSEVMVVTSPTDLKTIEVAASNNCQVFTTDSFYANGAQFNKWLALEEGLDQFGRHGWLCIMDADIVWPTSASIDNLKSGYLYSPLRRMMKDFKRYLPPVKDWDSYILHSNVREWAGYSQIFDSEDEHLPSTPWHETDWKHAGGADSFFQNLWPPNRKVRTDWEVLHLGEAGRNWCGRLTPYLDSTQPEDQESKAVCLRKYMQLRKLKGNFDAEKIEH